MSSAGENIIQEINDQDLESLVFNQSQASMVLFKATWCPNCTEFSPIVEEFASQHPELQVYKIDLDSNMHYYAEFKFKSIPSFIFVNKNSSEVFKHTGKLNLEELNSIYANQKIKLLE